MNEQVKLILRRIVLQLRAALEGDEFALEDLQDALAGSGATAEDIEVAFEAILSLTEPNRAAFPPDAPAASAGNRVLSLEERSRLTPEAFGYLLGVRGKGAIDEEQFEWVLERALSSSERTVGLGEIQDLVLEVALGGADEGPDRSDMTDVH